MILRWLLSKTVREAQTVHKHYRRLLAAQRDILQPQAIAPVQLKLDELTAAIKEGHKGRIRIKAEELQFAAEKWLKPYPHAAWRENVEVLLVALAVAMGIRTFFLQPFKIPTGSMQPTLFGVTSEPDYTRSVSELDYLSNSGMTLNDTEKSRLRDEVARLQQSQKALVIPTGWNRVKEWFQGNSYLHFVAPAEGKVEAIYPLQKFLIFNLSQSFKFAGQKYTLWFPPDFGESDLRHRAGLFSGRVYHPGEDVIKIRASAGDHLFVDRLSYNFRRPTRGEIIVFETAGVGNSLYHLQPGQFYIKRMVAMGGENVQIGNDRHLIIDGKRLDNTTPHFEKVYSFDPKVPAFDSHYSGHLNQTVANAMGDPRLASIAPLFPDQDAVYQIPPEHYMVMGDNTANSFDSRAWGEFSRTNVIGKYFFVYWPFTSRFGCSVR